MVVCYYGSWSTYRNGNGKFEVENIDPFICTHVIYGFVGLDETTNTVKLLDSWNDLYDDYGKGAINRFVNLRNINPALKVSVAIGGWNEGSQKYSAMAASASSRATFVQSAVSFCLKYDFNGMDIDWEYPTDRGGVSADKVNYVKLLSELRSAFDSHGLLLTVAVSAGKATIDNAYDVPNVNRYVHYIHVMSYDYHGSWESFTGNNAPLYSMPQEQNTDNQYANLNFSINYWLNSGASQNKLVVGMPLYGHTFTLANSQNYGIYAAATGPGLPGPYTGESGFFGYNEICEKFLTQNWNVVVDNYQQVPYGHYGNQWLSYDNVDSIRRKSELVKSHGLAGGMVWSIETDDFKGICGQKYPLLSVINAVLRPDGSSGTTTTASSITTTAAGTTTTATSVATTTAGVTTTASGPATTTTTASTSDTNSYVLSKCTAGVTYVRDPQKCDVFYACKSLGGGSYTYYKFTCSSGLVFSSASNSCDWPANVDCNSA
ncbi:hypothetical protein CHUAL_008782 [Chamberlinius hualienensis]